MVSELLKLTAVERQVSANGWSNSRPMAGAVFMGVGAESARQALEYARVAGRAGCDAVMATPPMISRLSESQLVGYFRVLAEGVDVPLAAGGALHCIGTAIGMSVCYLELL